MNSVKIQVNVNAHINNLKCDIIKQNEEAYAILQFDNLGYGIYRLFNLMHVVLIHLEMLS